MDARNLRKTQDNSIALLVVSWDGYKDVWKPFFHCLFKYWPDCPYPVFLGSNAHTYVHDMVTPLLIGPDEGFSSNLVRLLGRIEQDWVIVWIEDILLSALVDTPRVRQLVASAQQKEAVLLRLFLLPHNLISLVLTDDSDCGIQEIPRGYRYRMSFNLGLWHKHRLLALLRPGETPWEAELKGSLRSVDEDRGFYCVSRSCMREPIFPIVDGVRRGKWTREASDFLEEEGLAACMDSRPVQTRREYLKEGMRDQLRYHAARISGARLWVKGLSSKSL